MSKNWQLLISIVYVDLPDAQSRCDILRTQARNIAIENDVDLSAIAADSKWAIFKSSQKHGVFV